MLKDIVKTIKDGILGNTDNSNNEELWDKVYKLWDNGESKKDEINIFYDYWQGKIATKPTYNPDSVKKSWFNVCNQIVETKIAEVLDAPFTTSVAPRLNNFADIQTIEDHQDVADIYDQALKDIISENNVLDQQEIMLRWGEIGGFCPTQVIFDNSDSVEGKIKIKYCDPRNFRWNKGAKSLDDITFIAYELTSNPTALKEKYGKNEDGTYNQEMCDKIDEIAQTQTEIIKSDKTPDGIVASQNTQTNTTELGYMYKRSGASGINADKLITLITIFVKDDTLYIPEKDDKEEELQNKVVAQKLYPNGRMIIFVPEKKHKIILDDKPIPESLKNLGNIDFFTPLDFDGLTGRSELENITPIQDRIDGAANKMSLLIKNQISVLVAQKDMGINEGSFVAQPVVFIEAGTEIPQVVSNQALQYAEQLMNYIMELRQVALSLARINETAVSGIRQEGTTSAEQVQALQESPRSSIRSIQRNFKDHFKKIGEKVLALIQEKYTTQRLIKLASGKTNYDFAKFSQSENGITIEILNKLGKLTKLIKVDPEWHFKVEVTSGTDIPRSRQENAMIYDKLFWNGILGDVKDPSTLRMYFDAIDLPNKRSVLQLIEGKQKELENTPIPIPTIAQILLNKDTATAFANILDSLKTNSQAKGQLLQSVGLNPATDDLMTAPAQDIFSKADVKDVAAISPNTVSKQDPQTDTQSRLIASEILDKEKGGMHAI